MIGISADKAAALLFFCRFAFIWLLGSSFVKSVEARRGRFPQLLGNLGK